MPWPILNPSHRNTIGEIIEQSDRAAAILAVSFLDERLATLLQAWLADEPKIISKVFGGSGPLASFSSRIDMGLLLGVLEPWRHRELHLIRKIRNDFTHSSEPITFDTARIRDQCENFEPPLFSDGSHMPSNELEKLKEKDFDNWMVEWISTSSSGQDTPRERYLIAVRMNYLNFDLLCALKRRGSLDGAVQKPLPNKFGQCPARRVPFPNPGHQSTIIPRRSSPE